MDLHVLSDSNSINWRVPWCVFVVCIYLFFSMCNVLVLDLWKKTEKQHDTWRIPKSWGYKSSKSWMNMTYHPWLSIETYWNLWLRSCTLRAASRQRCRQRCASAPREESNVNEAWCSEACSFTVEMPRCSNFKEGRWMNYIYIYKLQLYIYIY